MINRLNGFMRTSKIETFYKLIDYINEFQNLNILKLPLDNSYLSSNSWLAGFIDANGSFQLRSTEKSIKIRKVECRFELEQAQLDLNKKSNFEIMEKIGSFLLCLVKETKKNSNHPKFRIRTTSINSNLKLIPY